MRRFALLPVLSIPLAFFVYTRAQTPPRASGSLPAVRTAVRITFGERQSHEADYSGTLTLSEGQVSEIIPWRFLQEDAVKGGNGWSLHVRRTGLETQPDMPRQLATPGQNPNVTPAGFTAVVDAPPTSTATVATARATYRFRLGDLGGGRKLFFENGDVSVQQAVAPDRVSPALTAATDPNHDYPSFAVTREGTVWAAWQVYQNGGDQILAARATASGWSAPDALTAPGQDVYRTATAVDGRGRVWVVWSQRQNDVWDLVARRYDGRQWSAPAKLTNGNGPNFFHKLVADRSGNLHLVWVAHRDGQSHVMWSKLSGDSWAAAAEVSGPSAWMPDAAADSKGNLFVAWDSYRNGNYDIYMRRINSDGTMEAERRETESPRFQAHASIAVDNRDRVWLAWDESGSNWGKDWAHDDPWRGTVIYTDRRPRIAVLENGKWNEPVDEIMRCLPTRYNRYVQVPKVSSDASGRVWVALQVRTSTFNNRADWWAANGRWELFLTAYDGDRWRDAIPAANSSTRPDGSFQLLPTGSGVGIGYIYDNRPFTQPAGDRRLNNEIEFARIGDTEAGAPPIFRAYEESAGQAIPVHATERADVQRIRAYRIPNGGTPLQILRGDFHRHTEISQDGAGDGSLEDYFRYMIDAAAMDTGIVSDHNSGDSEYTWWRIEKAIDLFHIPKGFSPLFGYERSVPYPNGHRNIVFDHRGVKVLAISREERQGALNTGPILYPYLKQNRGICMLHSLATSQGSDFRDNGGDVEPLVEIYQGYHANYEYEGAPRAESKDYVASTHGVFEPAGFFWNALAKGYKLGVQSSSDHISTHTSYSLIYSPSANRTDIVESMRKRHAYGATDNIVLDFRARDRQGREWMMGDSIEGAGSTAFHVKVLGTSEIQSVEIIKSGKFVYRTEPRAATAEFDYNDNGAGPGQSWYYVRVIQTDRQMAWSSPIWVKQ